MTSCLALIVGVFLCGMRMMDFGMVFMVGVMLLLIVSLFVNVCVSGGEGDGDDDDGVKAVMVCVNDVDGVVVVCVVCVGVMDVVRENV